MIEAETFGSDWVAELYIERLKHKFPACTYRLFLDEEAGEYVLEYDKNEGKLIRITNEKADPTGRAK